MTMRTQQYAKAAFPRIEKIAAKAELKKEYGSVALSFPVMVLTAGLAQATGFLRAKGKSHHNAYLNDLAEVLGVRDGEQLHKDVIRCDAQEYQQLTRNVLDAAGWMKRYAQALLKVEETGGAGRD